MLRKIVLSCKDITSVTV